MRLGIRGQLLLPMAAVLLVILAVSLATAWDAVRRERAALRLTLDNIDLTLGSSHFPFTPGVLQQLKGLTGADYCLYHPGRETLATMSPVPSRADLGLDRLATIPADDLGHRVEWAGQSYFIRRHRPVDVSATDDTILAILYPVTRWQQSVAGAVRPALIFGTVGMLIAVGITLMLGSRFVSRIRDLEVQTRRVAAGDFTPVPLPRRDDEFRELAASVNSMAGRLSDLQNTLRDGERWRLLGQMSGGLAHQLRNGATGAKLALQLYLREQQAGDLEPVRVAVRQLDRIEVQLQRFLQLGRGESEPVESVRLDTVLQDAIDSLRQQYEHLGIALAADITACQASVLAQRDPLLQVFVNLLDNAIDACGPGGSIAITLSAVGTEFVCDIIDSGPGPGAEIAGRLFEPFVSDKRDGIGLGLAVVQKVIEGLHGRVSWDRIGSRTRFRVSLPAAADIGPRPASATLAGGAWANEPVCSHR
ncbi:MAG: HAMP domain-containing histidine kinase [Gemmataceae bacterium]|nr:HAMP domain-containing histidine kinase [Gemmataceae bacterium]